MEHDTPIDTAELRRLAEELWPLVDELCEQIEMFYLLLSGVSDREELADALDDPDLTTTEVITSALVARLESAGVGSSWEPEDLQEAGVYFPAYDRWAFERAYQLTEMVLRRDDRYSDEATELALQSMRDRFASADELRRWEV